MFLCVRSSDTGSNFCATNERRGTVRSIHRRPLPSSLAYLFLAKIAHFPMLLLPLAVVVSVVVFSRCCLLLPGHVVAAVVVVASNQGAEFEVDALVAPLPFSPKRLPHIIEY